jgi:uncharacterized HAD superfamily protein
MILFLIVLPRLNTSYNVLSCYKAILQAKMWTETQTTLDSFGKHKPIMV